MSENNNINSKDFLIGSLIGGIVGASIALFTAPKSGKELRSDINNQATTVKDKTSQFTTTAKEKGTEFADVARDKTESITKTVTQQSTVFFDKMKALRDAENNEESAVEDDIETPKLDNETEMPLIEDEVNNKQEAVENEKAIEDSVESNEEAVVEKVHL